MYTILYGIYYYNSSLSIRGTCSKFLDRKIKNGGTNKDDLKKALCINPLIIVSGGKVSVRRGTEASANCDGDIYYGYFGGDCKVSIDELNYHLKI